MPLLNMCEILYGFMYSSSDLQKCNSCFALIEIHVCACALRVVKLMFLSVKVRKDEGLVLFGFFIFFYKCEKASSACD